MTTALHCPSCGAELAAHSPEGLCPRCLMRHALDVSSVAPIPRPEAAVTFSLEPASSSVLVRIAETIGRVPHVLLRDTEVVNGPGPVFKPSSPEMPAPSGRPDKYQLFGEIARGGMGAVLRGRDVDLGRDLAVKVLLDLHKDQPELIKRFVEEAQIGGQLQHPGIVPVYELGSFADRRPFFTMKLVKGRTLADLLRARSAPADDRPRFLSIFEAIAQTMAYAHSRGVIHRDLKPSNVMVGSFGEVQVMDWGLAKVLPQGGAADDQPEPPAEPEIPVSVIRTARSGAAADASQAGSILGTPAYMAPEQARGELERVDERADVFGLGAILCEILTGDPAFTGRSASAILLRATLGELEETYGRLDGCGAEPELIALAKDCLAAEREDRPARAGVVAERITTYLVGVQERLRKAELARVEERARRRLTMAVAASVLGLLIVGGGGWAYLQRQRAERRAAVERQVTAALDEANLLRGQASTAPVGELGRWDEAIAAARRAEAVLDDAAAGEAVRGRVLAVMSGLKQDRSKAQAKADDLRRDRELLDRLESIYGAMSQSLDMKRGDAEITAAFRDFGVDLDQLDPKEAGRRLRARSAPTELAWYLDGLAFMRIGLGRSEPDWRRLVDASRVTDPDLWRDAVRATAGRRDAAAVAALHKLADDEKGLDSQPAKSLIILAAQLQNVIGDQARGESVLRRAWRIKPDDFFVNFLLGTSLARESGTVKDPAPRRAESVRYLTAAVAIRPGSPLAHVELGNALLQQGKPDDAVAEYRAALRLNPNLDWIHNNFGNALRGQGKIAEGIAEYREAIRLKPEEAGYHSNLGDALLEQRKPAEAIDAYRVVMRLLPGDAGPHLKLAGALLAQGNREDAIAECRAAARLKSNDANTHNNLAGVFLGLGKREEAIVEFRDAVRLAPDVGGYQANLAMALEQHGKPGEAADVYRAMLRREPNNAELHSRRGRALDAQGKPAEAIDEYRTAIRLQPDLDWAHNSLGNVLRGQGKSAEGIAEYRAAIRLRPGEAGYHSNLGDTLLEQGKPAEALDAYRVVMRLLPGDAGPHLKLAGALLAQGKREEAIAECREAARLKSSDAGTHNNLAGVLLGLGKREEAIAELREAIRLEPRNSGYHSNLGVALRGQGKWEEAVAEYREAIRFKPDDAGALNNAAWALALATDRPQGEYDEAAGHARRAVALAPKDGNIQNTLALAEYRCGRWDASISAAEQSMALRQGGNASDWFILAMAHARKGEKDEAIRWFDKAVASTKEKAPDDAELRQFWTEAAKLLGRPGPETRRP
jgi:serine/threonine-protein kinase